MQKELKTQVGFVLALAIEIAEINKVSIDTALHAIDTALHAIDTERQTPLVIKTASQNSKAKAQG